MQLMCMFMPIATRLYFFFRKISLLMGLLLVPALVLGQTFVQENDGGAASASSVNVTYTSAETASNLNVVVVGWNDISSSVTSVVDDNGNTYLLAGTSAGIAESQAIYYAPNIAVATINPPTVTVTFNQAANAPDVRILEYSGLSATNPLDNWAGDSGHSVLADSGGVVTGASDLILAAGTTSTHFTTAGAGFTLRKITSPFGDIVEDSNAAQPAGTYNGTAPMTNGNWVMQVAGFSTTPVTDLNPPVIDPTTPITPATGGTPGGTPVTINGTGFQPGAVVLFGTAPGGISGINCSESGGTTITCLTPADVAGVRDVTVVNVDGQLSSATAAYTYVLVVPPTFTAITPATGPTNGSAVTITGTGFQAGATVTIGGLPAGDVVVQDSATITAGTPGLPVGTADVTVKNPDGGTVSSTNAYTYALGTGAINFIQAGDAVAGAATTTLPAQMPTLQTAGNRNVVFIGWADTAAAVSSVTDSEGNTYVAALPTANGTGVSQAIYYAKNIVGDGVTPNTVTVTFSQGAQFPDVRVLEYSGLDTGSPLDTVATNAGTGTLADSGACTTTTAVELILSGGTVGTHITGPGTGFTLVDLTQPNGGSAQHKITSAAGSCQATAPLSASSAWIMQSVAFKLTPPDFSVGANPTTRTVVQGSPASYTISVTGLHGFSSAVILGCDSLSLPTGATCGFAPNPVTPGGSPATSTLTISTTSSTPVATSSVIVTASAGSLSHNTSVGLTVTAAPDFTIAASAASPTTIVQGGSATSTITIAPLAGFSSAVSLSCSNITPVVTPPPTCAFVPSSVPGGSGTSTLTISTQGTTPAGIFTLTVTGTSGSLSHNASVSLTVTGPPDFTVAATPLSPATVAKGASATSTITIAPLNGFTGAVSLSCSSITPTVTRAPACSFNPSSVPGGSGTSTLTVSTTAATTASVSPSRGIFYAMWLPIGGLALLGQGFGSRRKKLLAVLLLFLMLSGLIFMAACGGGSSSGGNGHPGTPAGTYTVTISATSGSLTHTTPVTLTVQ
ncbi:MAG: IPT/TIG domain-containing protein [Terriglobales bacterium]